jgi:hypothetical protein
MSTSTASSEYRVEKRRVDAAVTLSNGQTERGCFFLASSCTRHDGPERVADLLNSEPGFFPFEIHDARRERTVLYHRAHVVFVALADDEASLDPGYGVAPLRRVSLVLSNGERVTGTVRVYRPEGRNRISDWTRQPETFRYVETGNATVLVNLAHIVEVTDVTEP